MKILIATASRHGATHEIGDEIGRVLARDLPTDRFEVEICEASAAAKADVVDAVILGSAVFFGRWLPDAVDLLQELASRSQPPLVWLFSSGPVGDPSRPNEDPVDAVDRAKPLEVVDRVFFSGRLSRGGLKLSERAVAVAVGAKEGDFRNWDAIDQWAESIACTLKEHRRPRPDGGGDHG